MIECVLEKFVYLQKNSIRLSLFTVQDERHVGIPLNIFWDINKFVMFSNMFRPPKGKYFQPFPSTAVNLSWGWYFLVINFIYDKYPCFVYYLIHTIKYPKTGIRKIASFFLNTANRICYQKILFIQTYKNNNNDPNTPYLLLK